MKSIVSLFFALIISGVFYAQEPGKAIGNFKIKTTQEAHYSEGDVALIEYFYNNIDFSEEAKEDNLQGEVKVSFTVLPSGSLSDITVLKGIGYGIDEKVTELLGAIKFEPAMQNGMKVPSTVIYAIPLQAM